MLAVCGAAQAAEQRAFFLADVLQPGQFSIEIIETGRPGKALFIGVRGKAPGVANIEYDNHLPAGQPLQPMAEEIIANCARASMPERPPRSRRSAETIQAQR